MNNLVFMIWMLLYPTAIQIEAYIYYKSKMTPRPTNPKEDALNALIQMVIWFSVGYLLYNK